MRRKNGRMELTFSRKSLALARLCFIFSPLADPDSDLFHLAASFRYQRKKRGGGEGEGEGGD